MNCKRTCNFCGNLSYIENKKYEACKLCNPKIKENGKCEACSKLSFIIITGNNKKELCSDCFKFELEICITCNQNKLIKRIINNKNICESCYLKLPKHKKKCYMCDKCPHKLTTLISKRSICQTCYKSILKKEANCDICNKRSVVIRINDKLYCNECYKQIIELCYYCKQNDIITKTHNEQNICNSCYNKTKGLSHCLFCGNIDICMWIDKNPICNRCYRKNIQTNKICDICDQIGNTIIGDKTKYCSKCYKTNIMRCERCGYFDLTKIINGKHICKACYLQTTEKIKCSICSMENKLHSFKDKLPICKKCYSPPKHQCYFCGQNKVSKIKINEKYECSTCYCKRKIKEDESYRIKFLLRDRLRKSLKKQSILGKTKSSGEYGINYSKIIEHIGPCPGNREDYHIDHIFPLAAFDFNNPKHIAIAFSPENHQWLTSEENLKKGESYDKNKFKEFLDAKMQELQ